MEYTLFLDTNALLSLGENAFKEKFIIAQKTLEEIENIKVSNSKDGEVKYKARQISRLLDKHDGEYDVVLYSPKIKEIIDSYFLSETPDNMLIITIQMYRKYLYVLMI